MSEKLNEEFIEGLQKLGLSYNEAKVYYYLITYGKKGTIVKNLKENTKLERTTIYSILNRLLDIGCVLESKKRDASKQAKTFIAVNPERYMEQFLHYKRNKLKELEKIKDSIIPRLETLFLHSKEFSFELVDDFIKPYFFPLIENGWKIQEYIVEKNSIIYGFDLYDCVLFNPNAKFVKEAGFMILKYDHIIENDETTLNYMYGLLKRKGREEILNKDIGVKD
jgi:predicted transcriptional regulator